MNKKLIGIVLALAFPLAVTANPGEHKHDHEQYRAKKIERLDKELSLTDDQKSRIDTLFKQNGEKFKTIREETQSQLKTILTPEQYSKLQELKQRRQEQWRERHQQKMQEKKPEQSGTTQ
ncbi:hypothetical protein [Nitrosomonas sp. H1_AOB3]|uniref:hypothetical protein n=1 Tax=Nitrosomonas sp. H1_AOB3 TaxID=2741553 RepID=UPI001938D389|nr:hypothetical protein [Nitrosomonas sp. H1_AOB3]QOJ09237.1 MAG: hypothetical protein HRU73_07060 [Nitrosomonas sp. H1_AOB3]